MAPSPCPRRSRRCWPRGSISSTPSSGTCSGAARSRGACSTAGRCRRSRRTEPSSSRRSRRSFGGSCCARTGRSFPGEDAFRFRHLLIRDAAYEALPKATRADLHERFAGWIAERGADLVELDEVVGYHLERAYRYRVELGPAGEAARELSRACRRAPGGCGSEGGCPRRCAGGDQSPRPRRRPSARRRCPPAEPPALPREGVARGRAVGSRRTRFCRRPSATARAAGDRRVAAEGAVALTHLRLFTGSASRPTRRRGASSRMRSASFEEFGDEAGLARALGLAGQLRMWAGEAAAAIEDLERAAQHARAAGDRLQEIESLHYVLICRDARPDRRSRPASSARSGCAAQVGGRSPAQGDGPAGSSACSRRCEGTSTSRAS